ncbi:hypothetical protein ACFVUN_34770 [Kitasatospora griseola]|uniref:hypothetical protein n=1 Tax=Kitasatospora griseola TaxID=2064 RepID=UPI0036DBFACB
MVSEAAKVLERRAAAADEPGTRWMVDQDDDGALVLASYWPEDAVPGELVSTGTVAVYAYADHPDRYAPEGALAAAAHCAGLDPVTALALAAWLRTAAGFADRAEELGGLAGFGFLRAGLPRAGASLRAAQPGVQSFRLPTGGSLQASAGGGMERRCPGRGARASLLVVRVSVTG